MNIAALAVSNIRHNLKKYAVYFFAMWFCIFTTYTFLALMSSKSVLDKIRNSASYQSMFIGFGIAILIFTLFFLISSNNSFIRARKKEISMYSLFGMENAKIGRMLFFETLILGLLALTTAIVLGIFLSKLLTMILLNMVMSTYSGDIAFAIDAKSIVTTCAIYLVIFAFMGLSGLRMINRFQLVDLFKGDKISEGKSKGSYIMLVVSVVLILAGYFFAVSSSASIVIVMMLPVVILVVVGTYLFYFGGFQKIMHLIKRNKKSYYKKTKLISISLLSHRSRTMATMMATIAIFIAIGTTSIAFGYTLFQNAESQAYDMSIFDAYYISNDNALNKDVKNIFDKHDVQITDEIAFQRYGSKPNYVNASNDFIVDFPVLTYKESEYNKIASVAKSTIEQVSVDKGTALLAYKSYYDVMIQSDTKLEYGDTQLSAVYFETTGSGNFSNSFYVIVLNDTDFDKLVSAEQISKYTNSDGEVATVTGINYENSLSNDQLSAELETAILGRADSYRLVLNSYNNNLSNFGLLCFIGFFMCTVFMLMTASMLYFKQVTIATEERKQYVMLRKIGISPNEESAVIKGRLKPIFFFPMALGIIHSLFAMKGADTIIFTNIIASQSNTFLSVLKTSLVMYAVYIAVYTLFYFITKSQYKQTIR